MLWLNDAIIELLRQGIPLTSAIAGAAWGTSRMAGKGKHPKVRHVALYSGAGWLTGYVVSSLALKVLEGSNPTLPVNDTLPMPEPATSNMAGLPYDPPIGNYVGEVVAQAPMPEPSTPTIDVQADGENIQVHGTMDLGAMGSAYGG